MKKAYMALFLATQRGEVVSANERQVLVYMASVAHDDDDPPRYWAGQEVLAEVALGRVLPPADEDPKGRASILKSVSIATRRLVARGVIAKAGVAHPGRRQEFLLTVENGLPREWGREPDVPPFGTSGSTIPNVTFHRSERDVPPKEKQHQRPHVNTTDHQTRAAHLQPVENAA